MTLLAPVFLSLHYFCWLVVNLQWVPQEALGGMMSPGFSTSHLIAFLGFCSDADTSFVYWKVVFCLLPPTHILEFEGISCSKICCLCVLNCPILIAPFFWGDSRRLKTMPTYTIKTTFSESDMIFVSQLPIISFMECLLNPFPHFSPSL